MILIQDANCTPITQEGLVVLHQANFAVRNQPEVYGAQHAKIPIVNRMHIDLIELGKSNQKKRMQ